MIHLLSGGDERFAPGLVVTVVSALKNVAGDTTVAFHILDGGLSAASRRELAAAAGGFHKNARIIFHRVDTARLDRFRPGILRSQMYYARLEMGSLIDAERVIYIDSDTVVLADLQRLWRLDLGENLVAACPDRVVQRLGDDCPWPLEDREKNLPYFNSGVMVVDLDRWRRDGLGEESFKLAALTHVPYRWHDQTILNYVFRGKVKILPDSWNWQHERLSENLERGSTIIHFSTPKKPWLFWRGETRNTIWSRYYSAAGGCLPLLFLTHGPRLGFFQGLFETFIHRSRIFRSLYLSMLRLRCLTASDTDREKFRGRIDYYRARGEEQSDAPLLEKLAPE